MRPPTSPTRANPGWLARFAGRFPGLSTRYLTLDARALGLARIYIGCLLLCDLGRRVPYLNTFYTNDGLLPNHTLLWRPGAEYQFSFFFMASHAHEAAFLFALSGVIFALFTLGYRTRLLHLLSLSCLCSLHGRLIFFDDGSETSTRLLLFWTLFLPMGCRFSLDALRRTLAPSARESAQPSDAVITLAVPAILLQLAAIYLLNAVHKSGLTWREGTAVHYVLHQDRIVTWLGWVLRPHLTLLASRAMTYAALAIESSLPLLILSPVFQPGCRRLAIALAIALHLGFALLLNLGLFSFSMIGFFLLLLPAGDLDWLARAIDSRPRLARIGAHLRALAARILAYCEASSAPSSALRAAFVRHAPGMREAAVVLATVVLACQLLSENDGVPQIIRVSQPLLFRVLVEYPRLYEGWSMFAPEAPTSDLHVFVDAVTADGRHVDPLNEVASRVARTPLTAIPERLGHDDSFCDYIANIVGAPAYHAALEQWIFAYDARTGRARDRITSFKVFVLEDDSPEPGATTPTNTRERLLLEARR